jgi:hypothetical protein
VSAMKGPLRALNASKGPFMAVTMSRTRLS